MLNIYYGRESIDKEKFIYQTIAKHGYSTDKRTLVVVPDQYTLEAEKQAFRHLGAESLMGFEVMSMSRLGHNILEELGGSKETFIDKYGRQMLLTRIAREEDENLQVFKGNLAKSSFIELTNNFISEMKQYGATPETLNEIIESLDKETLLCKKLADLKLIYDRYQSEIDGKYTDSEDYIDLYIDRIGESRFIKNSTIWIYGFDSFAPKSLEVIEGFMGAASEVNVVLTYDKMCSDEDLFDLTGTVMRNLIERAGNAGCRLGDNQKISDEFAVEKNSRAIAFLEKELYAMDPGSSEDHDGITIVEAANMYNEAESAAAYILHLLRDKGFRYRDIVVICNDQQLRASIITRVFEEYDISLFSDTKRKILNSNVAIFLVSMLTAIEGGYRSTDIFKTLKTGLSSLSADEMEKLENYSIKYRINGSTWKKEFTKGEFEYGQNGLAEINGIRAKAMEIFESAEAIYRRKQTVSEFCGSFYDFLIDKLALTEKIGAFAEEQSLIGLTDLADETEQIWTMIVGILDQIAGLVGDDKFEGDAFIQALTVGLNQIEVGVLPSTSDDLMMGTMQRTRSGEIKALIVIGANEGILPAESDGEGLFAKDELEKLAEDGHEICKVDNVRIQEERLAIYRNLCKPTDALWMSFSTGDQEGKEIRPSDIVDTLKRIYPGLEVQRDVLNRETPEDIIGGRISTLRHYTEAINNVDKTVKIDPLWKSVEEWYQANDDLSNIKEGFDFENKPGALPESLSEILFKHEDDTLAVSPSRIETFAKCPFAHFITYGLKPEERRVFEVASREIGDVYHACLMRLTSRLSHEGTWDTVTEEECRRLVREVLQSEVAAYREGLFSYGNEEKYKSTRMEDTCFQALWILIGHYRSGSVEGSSYEIAFGNGRPIKPVEVNVGKKKVYIEGKIDRLDVLENGRLKIIDYKSGNNDLNQTEIKAGYRLQLMLYMKAAQEGQRQPAGVFYFHIQNPRVDSVEISRETDPEKISEKISQEIRKKFKLNGIMVNDAEVIKDIAGEFDKSSDIAPLKIKADGTPVGNPKDSLVTEEEFKELQEAVDVKVQELCEEMLEGRIDIAPMKSKNSKPCDFCEYKSICRFDTGFTGCRYNVIR